ncbi:MAG TPA: AAA family ATPase [Terriglobales bacterium]|nr:AAA family ATPase [Terriglobales bacterium]
MGFEKSRPVLHQISNRVAFNAKTEAEQLKRTLVNMQRLEPVPSVLREYSTPQQVRRMGEHGENFAALVKSILDDEKAKSNYLSWLKQLTPNEVDEVKILKGALGEPLFALVERGQEYPAPVLSDGTLRFAAIAAAFFQPDMPEMITIEEIENGIHPNRLRLLVELLKSQTIGTGRQVVATTHSPVLLSWLKREDYDYTFYCKRSDQTGESIIRPLSQIPRFLELAEKQPVGELFAEGWPENAL